MYYQCSRKLPGGQIERFVVDGVPPPDADISAAGETLEDLVGAFGDRSLSATDSWSGPFPAEEVRAKSIKGLLVKMAPNRPMVPKIKVGDKTIPLETFLNWTVMSPNIFGFVAPCLWLARITLCNAALPTLEEFWNKLESYLSYSSDDTIIPILLGKREAKPGIEQLAQMMKDILEGNKFEGELSDEVRAFAHHVHGEPSWASQLSTLDRLLADGDQDLDLEEVLLILGRCFDRLTS